MLTMDNPNGVFLALEELGSLLASVALVCLVPAFGTSTRSERVLRHVLQACFTASVVALAVVTAFVGADRQDTFEIAVISVGWLTTIVAGPLVARVLRHGPRLSRRLGQPTRSSGSFARASVRLLTSSRG